MLDFNLILNITIKILSSFSNFLFENWMNT